MSYYVNVYGDIPLKDNVSDNAISSINKFIDELGCMSDLDIEVWTENFSGNLHKFLGISGYVNYKSEAFESILDKITTSLGSSIDSDESECAVYCDSEECEHWRFLFKDGVWIDQIGHITYQ